MVITSPTNEKSSVQDKIANVVDLWTLSIPTQWYPTTEYSSPSAYAHKEIKHSTYIHVWKRQWNVILGRIYFEALENMHKGTFKYYAKYENSIVPY